MLGRCDITDPDEVRRYVGRAQEPTFALRPVLPPKCFNTAGPRRPAFHLKGIAQAVDDLTQCMEHFHLDAEWARGKGSPWGRQQQAAARLHRRLHAARSNGPQGPRAELGDFQAWIEGAEEVLTEAAWPCHPQKVAAHRVWLERLRQAASAASASDKDRHFAEIKKFYREASEGAASLLHRLTKVDPPPSAGAQASLGGAL